MSTDITIHLDIKTLPSAEAAFDKLYETLGLTDQYDTICLSDGHLAVVVEGAEISYRHEEVCWTALTEFCRVHGAEGAVMLFNGDEVPVGPTPAARKKAVVDWLRNQIDNLQADLIATENTDEAEF